LTEKQNVFHHHDGDKDLHEVRTDEDDAALKEEEQPSFEQDPFVPFTDLGEEPKRIITIRAVFVGLCCGALVNASNVYLGLKTGWTFTANLFGVSSSWS
jgi:hypothetical protein